MKSHQCALSPGGGSLSPEGDLLSQGVVGVSARPRHWGNPALQSEKAPRKMEGGPI